MGLSHDRWRSPHQRNRRSHPYRPSCAERVAPGPTSRPIHSRLARRRATRMPVACPGARVLVSETTAGAALRIEVGLPAPAPSAWRRGVCSRRRRPRRTWAVASGHPDYPAETCPHAAWRPRPPSARAWPSTSARDGVRALRIAIEVGAQRGHERPIAPDAQAGQSEVGRRRAWAPPSIAFGLSRAHVYVARRATGSCTSRHETASTAGAFGQTRSPLELATT
jgi:hypothetical protein